MAQRLIAQTCERQGIAQDTLTIHADRGAAMLAKSVALLLADLGVTKTHGRPHVSNDNPYSESHFKTLKYSPEFPDRFGSLQDARSFLLDFFQWYNTMHHHSGLGLLTPLDVHHGLAETRLAEREAVLRTKPSRRPRSGSSRACPPRRPCLRRCGSTDRGRWTSMTKPRLPWSPASAWRARRGGAARWPGGSWMGRSHHPHPRMRRR